MDAIRKKMQSLKVETDQLVSHANTMESQANDANKKADKHDCDIRDLSKKINAIEAKYDEASEALLKAESQEEEKNKEWKTAEEDVNNLNRRMLLVEEECKRRDNDLATTTMDLCNMSRTADSILRKVKVLQSKNMTDEVLLEELDKDVKEAKFMQEDGEKKCDEISRRLGVMEDELRRALERAELADNKNVNLEEQLRTVGENMHDLEVSEEKAIERDERYKEQIREGR